MTTEQVLEELRTRIQAGYPFVFLRTWEEERWEQLIAELVLEMERGLVTWTATQGFLPPLSTSKNQPEPPGRSHETILRFPDEHVFLMKDIYPFWNQPEVVRGFRDMIPTLIEQKKVVLFLDARGEIPLDLSKDSVRIELPFPGYEDLRADLDTLLNSGEVMESTLASLTPEFEDRLIKSVMGLSAHEANHAWRRSLFSRQVADDSIITELVAEKRSLAAGSDLLEFYDLEEGMDDVGGLDELKTWLVRRSEAYSPRAREQGLPLPKGVLLLGVQGCGKSLAARVSARMLSFPLVRLDISNLLTSERGESERNLRNVLRLTDAIAPAVLWLDEIEKGFAGVEGESGPATDSVMMRLVGTFLTWMGEQKKQVFVVATANSVDKLPPEMLRRGRFDEMFFVDLPNYDERRHILSIHLQKRGWKPEKFNLDELAERSDGFSGAELETLVTSALIEAFGQNRILTDNDLDWSRRKTIPLSKTMEERIFALRQWAVERCRRATSDNRVTQMLETERRKGFMDVVEADKEVDLPAWKQLAQHGQLKAAIVEYVRNSGETTFPEIEQAFETFADTRGEQGLAVRTTPNVVLWNGLGKDFAQAIVELISSRRLYVHPTSIERYKQVQRELTLPTINEPSDTNPPKPSWLPSSLRIAPHSLHGSRLSRIGRMKIGK